MWADTILTLLHQMFTTPWLTLLYLFLFFSYVVSGIPHVYVWINKLCIFNQCYHKMCEPRNSQTLQFNIHLQWHYWTCITWFINLWRGFYLHLTQKLFLWFLCGGKQSISTAIRIRGLLLPLVNLLKCPVRERKPEPTSNNDWKVLASYQWCK